MTSSKSLLTTLLAAGLLLAPLGLAGCKGYYRDTDRRTTGEVTDDSAILTSVKTRLLANGQVRGRKINVDVRKSVVTLQGYIRSEEERAAALSVARQTRGVVAVEDKLVLLPTDN